MPRVITTHDGLGPKSVVKMPRISAYRGLFSVEVSSSQMTPAWVKLMKAVSTVTVFLYQQIDLLGRGVIVWILLKCLFYWKSVFFHKHR